MDSERLTALTCFEQIEAIEAFLRTPEGQRLTAEGRKLKFLSIQENFPETSNAHLVYCVAQWMQAVGSKGFVRFPSWAEVLAPLYRELNGSRHRAWGYRDDLPVYLAPRIWQLEAVRFRGAHTTAPEGAENPGAYASAAPAGAPQLPPARPGSQELESVRLEREARQFRDSLPPDHPHRALITVPPPRQLGMDMEAWKEYLAKVDLEPVPIQEPTRAVLAKVRMQAQLERLLVEGKTSIAGYNAQLVASQAVFPRPEFLRKHPLFRDPTLRDLGGVQRKAQQKELRKKR